MANRTIFYNGNLRKPITLEESNTLFVIRFQKGVDPFRAFDQMPSTAPFASAIDFIASFPESDVYIFDVPSSCGISRDEFKEMVRGEKNTEIRYIGSVFNYSNTGFFQIYTENIFLQFHEGVSNTEVNRIFKKYHLEKKRPMHFGKLVFFLESKRPLGRDIFLECAELLLEPSVKYCHPELVTKLRTTDRSWMGPVQNKNNLPKDWWLHKAGVKNAWQYSSGAGTTIAIIDDGIEPEHPAFANSIVFPRDMMDKSGNGFPHHLFNEGHGTACASIAVSSDKHAPGVAPAAKVMPIRITGLGSIYQSEAIYWAAVKGADVISCSWGPPDGRIDDPSDDEMYFPLPDHTKTAFEFAVKNGRNGKGTTIVFAAGNGNEPVQYDGYASAPEVIAVNAINYKNQRTYYADYGYPNFCCFPSGDREYAEDLSLKEVSGIYVADRLGEDGLSPTDYYDLFTGTSASCPGVAGVVALMYARAPGLNYRQVKEILKNSCEKVGATDSYNNKGYSQSLGYGLLKADRAVQHAISYNTQNPTDMNNNLNAISLHIGINYVDQQYYKKGYIPPLYGCVNDMNAMKNLAASLGYETHSLENEEATCKAITQSIEQLGSKVAEGGVLLISYAGHGVQFSDQGGDMDGETDGKDESWVAYDGFLLDDSIFNSLAKIPNNIRVVLISDSCHSEGMTRFIPAMDGEKVGQLERGIDERAARKILKINNQSLADLRASAGTRSATYQAYVLNLSASRGHETAKEIDGNGVFTKSFIEEYKKVSGAKKEDYESFIKIVDKAVNRNGPLQEPNLTVSHNKSNAFKKQFPLDIQKINLAKDDTNAAPVPPIAKPAPSNEKIHTDMDSQKPVFATNELLIESKSGKKSKSKPENFRAVSWREDMVRSRSLAGYGAWDKAYAYLIDNQDEDVEFVEPDLISNLYGLDKEEEVKRAATAHGYLDTYPNPVDEGSDNAFVWHLDKDHSQLKKANEHVFPEVLTGRKFYEEEVVKIAHIDTGFLPGHPIHPINLDYQNATSFDLGNDAAVDNDAPIAIAEQQGHGMGTMALLAGNWVDLSQTNNEYQGFFGAIPYAKVLPIKISETVALLSGKNFAKAVDYAIAQGCDVITMSMAGLPSKVMAKAVNRAYEAGVVIVSAASNSFSKGAGRILPKKTLYPARYDRVIAAVGATYNKKPYLNEYHQMARAAGGRFMQTCYGPDSALPYSLAAYTPNLIWWNGDPEKGPLYVKTGGGTSSATPQIAAAAALYIQKHKAVLSKYKGKDAWKKAEIVRQALFQSADASTEFGSIYGNGILRAFEALQDGYAPDKLAADIEKVNKAPERWRLFGGFFKVMLGRSVGAEVKESTRTVLEDMMATEISQLLHLDPNLYDYLDNLDLEGEEIDLDTYPELVGKIQQSSFASDFLKQHLTRSPRAGESGFSSDGQEFFNLVLPGDFGNVALHARGFDMKVTNTRSYKERTEETQFWVDEFELEDVKASRSLRSGASRGLEVEILDEDLEGAILVEKHFDDGTVYSWESAGLKNLERGLSRSAGQFSGRSFSIDLDTPDTMERGIFDGIKKVVVKVIKWFKGADEWKDKIVNDLVEPLGDKKYAIKVYDLESNMQNSSAGWTTLSGSTDPIYKAIQDDAKPVLLVLPGLFSKVESGFDDFLDQATVRAGLKKKYCRYVLGLNMPTVFHGIKQNAEELHRMLKPTALSHKDCTVLARSRGGIVARYLFDKTWINNLTMAPIKDAPFALDTLVMFGTPNQGTKMASSENWKSLFNTATNLARLTLGTVVPVIPTILSVIKAVGLQVVDLPGINDLEEESEVLKELNAMKKTQQEKYYVFTSDFEPGRFFKRLFDEYLVDRLIHKRLTNDTIVPVQSALLQNIELGSEVKVRAGQYHVSSGEAGVSHFAYLRAAHPEVLIALGKRLKVELV